MEISKQNAIILLRYDILKYKHHRFSKSKSIVKMCENYLYFYIDFMFNFLKL